MGRYDAGGPIRIKPGEPGRLVVRMPYTAERVEKIKTLRGRRWRPDLKCWTVPDREDMIPALLALFAGEQVEVAPALRTAEPPRHRHRFPRQNPGKQSPGKAAVRGR